MYRILYLLPKNYISAFVGSLASIPVPKAIRLVVIGLFAKLAGVRLEESENPLTEYSSVSHFFTRNMKPGLRPIADGIVSPVDGTLRTSTVIDALELEQIKGRRYSLDTLLGGDARAKEFLSGTFVSLYLAPPDYHHVHAPCDGTISGITYVPGALWPVNDWALTNIDGLFARNERVIIDIETAAGKVALVMVGAMNVGKMSLTFDALVTNKRGVAQFSRRYDTPISIKKGVRIGTFHLGSTVLLLFDAAISQTFTVSRAAGKIRYGESLLTRR